MNKQKLDLQAIGKIAVLFLISYGLLYLVSFQFFQKWDSPMYFLPPIVGFFVLYFLLDWGDEFFETDALHQWYLPVILVLLALLAEYITLFWYYGSLASMSSKPFDITFGINDPQVLNADKLSIGFVSQFKLSAFLPFFLACLLGWLSHLIIDKTQPTKQK